MIHRAPEIVCHAVDLHENLVQVPSPVRIRSMMNTPLSDFRGEHRTKPVPPEPHCFVADIDAAFEQQIFNLPQRQRIADVHHHREADHLGRAVEITEGITHQRNLRTAAPQLKSIWSDTALARVQIPVGQSASSTFQNQRIIFTRVKR